MNRMTREEIKELSIEFLNRAYELIELAETHPDDCPPESRYLSHGYSLKLEVGKAIICLVLFRKNEDGKEDLVSRYSEILVVPSIWGGYDVEYRLPAYMLNIYITYIIEEEG